MGGTSGSDAVGRTAADLQAAGGAVRQAGEQAQQAAAQAVGQAKDLAQDAMARGASLAGEVKQQVVERASAAAKTGAEGLADRLQDVAEAVHRSGEQLEGHQDFIASLVEKGADELAALASTLRTNDLQSLLGSLGSLARRQPALFLGASMAAGFVLARVGKIAVAGTSGADLPRVPALTSSGQGGGQGGAQGSGQDGGGQGAHHGGGSSPREGAA